MTEGDFHIRLILLNGDPEETGASQKENKWIERWHKAEKNALRIFIPISC